jgi:PAS domain S-box-containing protein
MNTTLPFSLLNESVIEFIAALIAIATILVLWKYRKADEVKYLIFVEFCAAIWAVFYALEFSTSGLENKILWSKFSYIGIAFLPLGYFLFTTAFSQKTHLINPRNISLLSVIPFLTIVLVFTNNLHHLIWEETRLNEVTNMTVYRHGVWFWIFWTYSIALILTGVYNLFQSIYKFPAFYKSQVVILLAATLIPLLGNVLYVSGLNPVPGFDWTPPLFVFTGLVVTFGIVRYRMFDLVPFARNKLIDTMEDGVLVVNSEGFIEDCNNAAGQIFTLNPHAVIRKPFWSVFEEFSSFWSATETQKPQTLEIEIPKSGRTEYFETRFSPVFNRKNHFSGHFIQVHNITSTKLAEEELKKANRKLINEIDKRGNLINDLESFSHAVAHDLKNSLGAISSSVEILNDSIQNNDKGSLHELAEMIKNSADKAIHITEELLILAKISHQEIELEPLNMQQIFKEAQNQLKQTIKNSGAKVKTPESWPASIGYAPWIETIWTNYLSNAIKYGGTPPEIEVGAEMLENDRVKFWIKDNGRGLTSEEQSKLFREYVRLAPEKADGYGLGLSIVKRITDKLGQWAGVENARPGEQGAVFYFTLAKA